MFIPKEEERWPYFGMTGTGSHTVAQCTEAIRWLAMTIPDCRDYDVSDKIRPAMDYLEKHVPPALVQRLWEALAHPDQEIRLPLAKAALKALTRRSPRYWQGK